MVSEKKTNFKYKENDEKKQNYEIQTKHNDVEHVSNLCNVIHDVFSCHCFSCPRLSTG